MNYQAAYFPTTALECHSLDWIARTMSYPNVLARAAIRILHELRPKFRLRHFGLICSVAVSLANPAATFNVMNQTTMIISDMIFIQVASITQSLSEQADGVLVDQTIDECRG